MIYPYLRFGCSYRYPKIKISEKIDLDYFDIRNKLNGMVSDSILKIKNPEEVVFQLSGGFDSSVVVSHFHDIKTFCTGEENSLDRGFAEEVSKYFGTKHTWMSHDDLLSRIDFKKAVIEINKINPHPRCFKNDLGLYAFLDYIKEHTDFVASGKGIEFQMLGYYTIYNKIIENAISRRQYSIEKAMKYLKQSEIFSTKDIKKLDIRNIIKLCNRKEDYTLNLVDWWTGTFSKKEIEEMLGVGSCFEEISFFSVDEILEFIFEWFGREYVDNRIKDFSEHFGITCYTPYVDDELVEFIKTIPIELKKCLNHHKFIFYQAMQHRLPNSIIQRPKEGLNTSIEYFKKHQSDIDELISTYIIDKNARIHNYIDIDIEKYDFNQKWSLLNLAIWMEHHDTNY
jgi:asparagine synthetase B (glutamine-hydrolysing)